MRRLFATFASLLLLTGCSAKGNISSRAYMRAAAFSDEEITFCFYSEEDGVISVPLSDPEKAKKAAELVLGKEIFTGHSELILLGCCDREEILEYALHSWKLSPSCMTAECEGSGRLLLEQTRGEGLKGRIEEAQIQGTAPKCDIVTVLGSLIDDKRETMIPEFTKQGVVRVRS